MKLGDKVKCTGYIKKSGNHFEIGTDDEAPGNIGGPFCIFWAAGSEVGFEVEEWCGADRYAVKDASFVGVYVGITTICTRINAEFEQREYGGDQWRTYCDQPKDFAVVYYANNKRRLVPLDRIEVVS
jgi:hypothetical protein